MEKNVKNFGITRTFILRMLSLTVILAFMVPAMTNAQGGKANFAGNWTFNTSKSQMGEGGGGGQGGARMGMGNFVATQDANMLTVTRTGQDGTSTVSKYTLDGKESVNTTPRGDSKSVATWSADGKTLTIVTTRETQNGSMKSSEAWTLTDANTLSRTTTTNFGGNERKMVMVYDKK